MCIYISRQLASLATIHIYCLASVHFFLMLIGWEVSTLDSEYSR